MRPAAASIPQWDIKEILLQARGEWLLFVEPGARPQSGWIDEIAEYVALNKLPARFTASRGYRRPFYKRMRQSAAAGAWPVAAEETGDGVGPQRHASGGIRQGSEAAQAFQRADPLLGGAFGALGLNGGA
jgi:hypothetical protein